MKETKKFFDTNRLNKGYTKVSNYKQTDTNIIRNKYTHALPPIDIIAEYEEMNPGTIEKILKMAEKEQNHRFALDIKAADDHKKALNCGRQSAITLVAIISIACVIMAFGGHYIIASIFALSGFGTIVYASSLKIRNNPAYKGSPKNYDPNYKKSNYTTNRRRSDPKM